MNSKPVELSGSMVAIPEDDWGTVTLTDSHSSFFMTEKELQGLIHAYHKHKSDKAIHEAALRDVPNNEHIVLGTD